MANVSNLDQVRVKHGSFSIGIFDGEERFIRYDLNAFASLEEHFGSMAEVEKRLNAGSMSDIRTVLWVGLQHCCAVIDEQTGEPIRYTISAYQVGSWITSQNIKILSAALASALDAASPDEVELSATLASATPVIAGDAGKK